MNAVLRKRDPAGDEYMPVHERDDLAVQVAELRADVRHIQSDSTEIKAELRVTNQRLDSLSQRTDVRFENLERKFDERFDGLEQMFDGRFGKVDGQFEGLERKFDSRFEKVDGRFERVDARFERLEKKFGDLKDSLTSAKLWALGLYIALSGTLLYVLAHGFKWL